MLRVSGPSRPGTDMGPVMGRLLERVAAGRGVVWGVTGKKNGVSCRSPKQLVRNGGTAVLRGLLLLADTAGQVWQAQPLTWSPPGITVNGRVASQR